MEKISVFLADWQVLFREGIHFTLCGEDDMEVTGEATSGAEAITAIEANPPRVAILNINGEKLSGAEAARSIRRNLPSVAVILVTDTSEEERLFTALKSGAAACVTKNIDPDDLVNIIRRVSKGESPIAEMLYQKGIASRILSEFEGVSVLGEELSKLLAHLSPRESSLLQGIASGSSIPQLAQTLGMTEEAIRTTLGTIHTKLVANEHHREVTLVAQEAIPLTISREALKARLQAKPGQEYVTRAEFEAFKESLKAIFKSLMV